MVRSGRHTRPGVYREEYRQAKEAIGTHSSRPVDSWIDSVAIASYQGLNYMYCMTIAIGIAN